jgi:hypothetical protein
LGPLGVVRGHAILFHGGTLMKTTICGLVLCSLFLVLTNRASAAIESRSILKTYFETGDVPTQDQFSNLIDSFIHQTEDGLTIYGMGIVPGAPDLRAGRKFEDDVIDITLAFAPIGPGNPIPLLAPEFSGESGFLALQLSDSLCAQYFGYFQLHMDPASISPQGIHVDYFAFESTAGQSLSITSLPEPSTIWLLAAGGVGVFAARRWRGRAG